MSRAADPAPLIVIGDIHGCAKSLEGLLAQLPVEAALYATGDLIDRGPDSRRVVGICMERGIRPVMGNHEHMLLDYLDGTGFYGSGVYFANGGGATLESYGGRPDDGHIAYLRQLPLVIETEYFILSHGGVHFLKTLDEACDMERSGDFSVLWNRGPLADLGKLQVVGHTPQQEVREILSRGAPAGLNIDTGCGYGGSGRLTAVSFPGREIYRVECGD